jgi:hypothetical protein
MTQALNDARHDGMHKTQDLTGADMLTQGMMKQPFGAGFSEEEMVDAERMEVWVTLFSHSSPKDFTLFELYDSEDNLIASKKIEGY